MKKTVLFCCISLVSLSLTAQTADPVIMQINGKDIKKSEFEYIYKKNNNSKIPDQQDLQEYIELFKNFKLKVAEAEALGLDTTQAFIKELNEYRNQLAKPYLSDFPINEDLVKKEYERSKYYLQLSHIITEFKKPNAEGKMDPVIPADTVAPYKKAESIYKKVKKAPDFEASVIEFSDEESRPGRQPGLIGWVTALQLPEGIENAAYNTPEGNISLPTHSSFGFHIIKVDKKVADPGQIRAAHILLMIPKNSDEATIAQIKQKADSVYQAAISGVDFAELVTKYSDDQGTVSRGGDLSWFGFGAMVPEFQEGAFALQNTGDISKPVQSAYGFHIIKLLDKKAPASYEDVKKDLISKIERTDRLNELREPALALMKKNNGFSPDEKSYKLFRDKANLTYPNDTTFLKAFEGNESVLFLSGKTVYTINDFITFLKGNPNSYFRISSEYLNDKLADFEYKSLLKEEDKNLENKYSDFKNLMNEYRDGILLFEVSNNEVWEKASKDTDGLKEYFDANKANYTWDKPHYKGCVVHCKTSKEMKNIQKETSKMSPDEATQFIREKYNEKETNVTVEKGLYVENDNAFVDELIFKSKKAEPMVNYPYAFTIGKLLNAPESYTDIRGLVITDYQNYLEKEWIKELNKKYPVTIYEDVVNSVK